MFIIYDIVSNWFPKKPIPSFGWNKLRNRATTGVFPRQTDARRTLHLSWMAPVRHINRLATFGKENSQNRQDSKMTIGSSKYDVTKTMTTGKRGEEGLVGRKEDRPPKHGWLSLLSRHPRRNHARWTSLSPPFHAPKDEHDGYTNWEVSDYSGTSLLKTFTRRRKNSKSFRDTI